MKASEYDIDQLNGLLYEAVKAGRVKMISPVGVDPLYIATEQGVAWARTHWLAQGGEPDALSVADTLSVAAYGFLLVSEEVEDD